MSSAESRLRQAKDPAAPVRSSDDGGGCRHRRSRRGELVPPRPRPRGSMTPLVRIASRPLSAFSLLLLLGPSSWGGAALPGLQHPRRWVISRPGMADRGRCCWRQKPYARPDRARDSKAPRRSPDSCRDRLRIDLVPASSTGAVCCRDARRSARRLSQAVAFGPAKGNRNRPLEPSGHAECRVQLVRGRFRSPWWRSEVLDAVHR